MKIALLSPWPPQRTGIADYAYDLASELIQQHVVDVYTQLSNPLPLPGVRFHKVRGARIPNLAEYDSIVYQMGNNPFHRFVLPVLQRYGGTVHLHDLVIHDFLRWITLRSDISHYLDSLERWYGPTARRYMSELNHYQTFNETNPAISASPLCGEVLQYADQCIVHSRYARNEIRATLSGLSCKVIPQLYANTSPQMRPPASIVNIGIFGGIDPYKLADVALRALAGTGKHRDFKLHIVGSVNRQCQFIFPLVEKLGIGEAVEIHGRVSAERFDELMDETDICLALRHPTRGETSAVVMRALQRGIPTIVSDAGWYSELPDFVTKIPIRQDMESILAERLKELLENPEKLLSLRRSTVDYAKRYWDFESTVREYADFLAEPRSHSAASRILFDTAVAMQDAGITAESADAGLFYSAIDALAPLLAVISENTAPR